MSRYETQEAGMNTARRLELLTIWETQAKRIRAQLAELSRLFGAIDSPLASAIWAMDAEFAASVGREVGDKCGWLDWWSTENDFGSKFGEGVSVKRRKMPSRTLADLVAIIEATR